MGWSKATRISIMLLIDIVFFIIELGVGLAVGSLALMADAFHMLNDIISLAIGLWAVKMSEKPSTDEFSFGYKRYEILGAFFNAVFLIALCITIALEAVPRLVNPPVITDPMLILYVGCAGLASNLVGFFVLGGLGHGHGHEDQEHSHDELHEAEEGHSHIMAAEGSVNVGEGLPVAERRRSSQVNFTKADEEEATRAGTPSPVRPGLAKSPSSRRGHHRTTSSYEGYEALSERSLHPSRFREGIIAAANRFDGAGDEATESESEEAVLEDEANEQSPLILKTGDSSTKASAATHVKKTNGHDHSHDHDEPHRHKHRHSIKARHAKHNHNKPQEKKLDSHGHNHADMGMNAMILHVAGDALGNVGVIASALVIWLSDWNYKYYVDPFVSLFIAVIILKSCIPLSKASGKILCQATPEHINISDIREDLQSIDGVVNCHHIHVWQLSDSTIVASLHLRVAFGRSTAKDEATYMSKYMQTANEVQECLHAYGIHSSTIQPEFCWDNEGEPNSIAEFGLILDGPISRKASGILMGGDDCMLECIENCEAGGCCVPTSSVRVSRNASIRSHDSHSGHSHSHSH